MNNRCLLFVVDFLNETKALQQGVCTMVNCFTLLVACFLLFAVPVQAASGVKGRVAWRSELIQGVTVSAYHGVEDIAKGNPVATSKPSNQDGIYQLELPSGSYVLTASNSSGRLKSGDLFGYFNGSPLQVPTTGYRTVGFNLIKVPEEKLPKEAERSGIFGEISYQDEPLERVYLYIYKEAGGGFKGLGYFVQPVERGKFRVNLPPGDYYVLARKRARGGQFGPIEPGDYYSYYYGNPVHVASGVVRPVKIEMLQRLALLEEEVSEFHGLRGQVVDASGLAQQGLYVFAYRDPRMTGTPDFFSAPSGPDGHFELKLPDSGPYYLLARQAFGGPAGAKELYGKLYAEDGTLKAVNLSQQNTGLKIRVSPQ